MLAPVALRLLSVWAAAVVFSSAASSETIALGVSGFVPLRCSASFSAQAEDGAQGTLVEMCNNPSGYRLHADYSPEFAGSKIYIDGQEFLLSSEGTTILAASSRPTRRSRLMTIEVAPGVQQNGQIFLRAVPSI